MKDGRNDHGAYVRRVQEETQTFAQDVMGEVQRLRVLVATLEREMSRQQAQVASLRAEGARHQEEEAALKAQLEVIRAETEGYTSRYAEIELQNSNLANLYVASYRLHSTLDRTEVIAAIQEILANLIGSEEAALFELDPAKQTLELVAGFGVDPEPWRSVPVGTGLIGRAAVTGETFVAGEGGLVAADGAESRLTACVPLKLDGRVMGVIAIFSLLPQKSAIEELDHELFDVLATQAAFALYCTSLHARVALEVAHRW
jgi:putative methionine-R-sulfoxide reductase with GAF domain